MSKTILLTGATDGIGLETAKVLVAKGHTVLLHGRSLDKMAATQKTLANMTNGAECQGYLADLSKFDDTQKLAKAVIADHSSIDIVINNAGILNASQTKTAEGLDVRFMVNTIAPYLLTQLLLPHIPTTGRIINLSSAAQRPVDLDALSGKKHLSEDLEAYAQSKLAITMWTREMALKLGENGPVVVSVNPGSLLATKMAKTAFGVQGNDIGIGSGILETAALGDEFSSARGLYYDTDNNRFADPHPDGLDSKKSQAVVAAIETVLKKFIG